MIKRRSHKSAQELFQKGKTMILACDQGFEHGPKDFNQKNIDPNYIMDLALEGRFNGVAVQGGVAEKYHLTHYRDVPLIVKLNAKTSLHDTDPVSLQHTSVKHAATIGAKAIGYTLYPGSNREQEMYKEFGYICEEAHALGLTVIAWVYPRGKAIKNELDTDVIAYGARIAMELGADVIKVKFNGDVEGFKWVVSCAGRAKIIVAGGSKVSNHEFLKQTELAMKAGAFGIAVGRNIWQNKNAIELSKALKKIIFEGRTAEEAFASMKK